MATNLGELNIFLKLKGLPAVKSGLKETRGEVDKVSKSAKESAKVFVEGFKAQEQESKRFQQAVRSINRDLNSFSRNLTLVSNSARLLGAALSVPLVLGIREAAKSNLVLSDSLKSIQDSSNNVLRSIGNSMAPLMSDIAKVVKQASTSWLDLNPEVRDSVVRFTAFSAATAIAVSAVGGLIARIIKLAQLLKLPALAALLGGSGIAAAGGLVGAATGIAVAKTKSPLGGQFLQDLMTSAGNPFQAGANAASSVGMNIGKSIGSGQPIDLGSLLVTKGGGQGKPSVGGGGEGGGGGENPFQPLISGFQDASRQIQEMNRNMGVTIRDTLSNTVVGAINNTSAAVGNAFAQSIVYGKDFEESMKEGMKAIAAEILSTLIGVIAKVIILRALGVVGPIPFGGASGGASSGGGGIGGFFKSLIPFASGGVVTKPTMSLIGEAGPEAVIPLDEMKNMGGGMTVNISGPLFLEDEAAQDKFVRKLQDAMTRITRRRTGGTSLAF